MSGRVKKLIILALPILLLLGVTNIPSGGLNILNSARTAVIQLFDDGDATFDGTITAGAFVGDGSGITGIVGSGDTNGPASATDNAITRFDGTTGKLLQNSSVLISDAGNVTLSGTVDGRDLSTDGTKLDGIESGATADQSDAEIETAYNNQVAAASQAEMEAGTSTSIRRMTPQRVAQAIAALGTGTTGPGSSTDNAVVRWNGTGGNSTQNSGVLIDDSNNITLSGTVDGRDISTDGTKLDGIESGATADQTDAEIETAYNNRVAVVSQATAEAGISSTVFRWTPARVADAIAALAPTSSTTFDDSTFYLYQHGDNTARGYFDLSNLSTATNITISWPTSNLDLDDISDSFISDTLTSSKFVGSGSTSDAVDLNTAETAGDLPFSKLAQVSAYSLLGNNTSGTTDATILSKSDVISLLFTPKALTSSSGSVTWNNQDGIQFNLTNTEATTIGDSTGTDIDGQPVQFIITAGSGAGTVSWNAVFAAGTATWAGTIPANSTTLGDVDIYKFVYLSGKSKYVLLAHELYN